MPQRLSRSSVSLSLFIYFLLLTLGFNGNFSYDDGNYELTNVIFDNVEEKKNVIASHQFSEDSWISRKPESICGCKMMTCKIIHRSSLTFRLPQIYEEFYHTVNNADHEKDLKWWSNNHGVNMAMAWPQFEVSYVDKSHKQFPFFFIRHYQIFLYKHGVELEIFYTFVS